MSFVSKIQEKNIPVYLVILFSIVSGCLLFAQILIDDAFIFFRYGYNLIHHGYFNWHANNQYVEAYTSYIVAILSIIPPLLNIEPFIFIKAVGFVTFLIAIYRIYINVENKKIALFAVAIFVGNWQTYVHTFAGLETLIWFLLILELFIQLKKTTWNTVQQIKLWTICLMLPLTRPEGAVFAFFAFSYLVFYKKTALNYWMVACFVAVGLAYYIWRTLHYGFLFPMPFYQKSIQHTINRFYLLIFNIVSSWHYLLCGYLLYRASKKNTFIKFVFWICYGLFFVLYAFSFLQMNYADRFAYQLFFPLFVFVIMHLQEFDLLQQIRIKYTTSFLVLLLLTDGIASDTTHESMYNNATSSFYLPRAHYTIAKHVNRLNNKNITVLFGDAGMLPYYAHVNCIDLHGLADNFLSRNKLTPSYFNKVNADIILLGSFHKNREQLKNEIGNTKIVYDLIDKDSINYQYKGIAITSEKHYFIHCYVHKKSTYATQVDTAISNAILDANAKEIKIKKFLNQSYVNFYKEK
jgi:hypothetical protein